MNTGTVEFNDLDEDDLFVFCDGLSKSSAPLSPNGLDAVAWHVHVALTSPMNDATIAPSSLKRKMWDQIMQSTTAATAGSASLQEPKRLSRQSATGRRVPNHPLPAVRGSRWHVLTTVALVALLALTSFASWQWLARDPGAPNPTAVPAASIQVATPESSPEPAANALASISGCDLSNDVPIIPDLSDQEQPIPGTSIFLVPNDPGSMNPRGDLFIGCDGQESYLLSPNVNSASPGPWPGTLAIYVLPPDVEDLGDGRFGYLDMRTGKAILFGPMRESQSSVPGSPWVVGPSPDLSEDWIVVDLRTMESRVASDLFGIEIPNTSLPMLSTVTDAGGIALGFSHNYDDSADSGTLLLDTGASGDLLLLGDSFEDTNWLTLPEEASGVRSVSLSPDGSLATLVVNESDRFMGPFAHLLIDIEGTKSPSRSAAIDIQSDPFAAWVNDGQGIAYISSNSVNSLGFEGESIVFEAAEALDEPMTTYDPNVIVVSTLMDHGSDQTPGSEDIVYSVNVSDGTVHEFPGVDASAAANWIRQAGALVMYQWDDSKPKSMDYKVYDPVTGGEIGAISDAPSAQTSWRTLPTIGPDSIAVSANGALEVIGLGTQNIFQFTLSDEGFMMTAIPAPDGLLSDILLTESLVLSPDGRHLSLRGDEDEGRVRYLTPLRPGEVNWTAIENTIPGERGRGSISFMAGFD